MGGPEAVDDSAYLRFRVQSVRVVALLAWALAGILVPYELLTRERPHRPALLCLEAAGVAITSLLLLAPLDRLVRSRWREPFFLAYSIFCLLIVSVVVLLDGGSRSPITVALVLPTLFAALSYPVRSTIAIGAVDLVAYAAVCAATAGIDPVESAVIGGVLALVAGLCGWHSRIHERQRAELRVLARTDALTGCLNRRGFEERLDAEVRHARREGLEVGLLVLDLDGFKAVNDRDGHAAGDALLRRTAATATRIVRPRDAVGRVGGDEFAVVLPGADEAAAAAVARRLGTALADHAPATIGAAVFPHDGPSPDALLRCADGALYRGKRARPAAPAAA